LLYHIKDIKKKDFFVIPITCTYLSEHGLIPSKCCVDCHASKDLFKMRCGDYDVTYCCGSLAYFDTLNKETLKHDLAELIGLMETPSPWMI